MSIYRQELAYSIFHSIQTDDRYGRENHAVEMISKISELDVISLEKLLKLVNENAYNVLVLGHPEPKTLRELAFERYMGL